MNSDDDSQPPAAKSEAAAFRPTSGTDAISEGVDAILADDGWEPLVAPIIEGLQKKIATAQSVDEVREILREQAQTMDVDVFANALAQMAFGARILGEVNEELD